MLQKVQIGPLAAYYKAETLLLDLILIMVLSIIQDINMHVGQILLMLNLLNIISSRIFLNFVSGH